MTLEKSTLEDANPKEKKKTPEEIAELEKSRTLSDAAFLWKGAFYTINNKGEKILNPLPEHIEHWRKEMKEKLKYKGLSEDEINRIEH